MQQELLIEFFSEEIPARMQKKALDDAKKVFKSILVDVNAIYDTIETYISPRRIAIRVTNLLSSTKDVGAEKRGPKIEASEININGFLKSNNCSLSDLIQKDGYFYFATKPIAIEITKIVPNMIEKFIEKMPWEKSMKWYLAKEKKQSAYWIRPIRSILCIYNGEYINSYISSVGLNTCDYTYGHRFLSQDIIRIIDFEDYVYKLEKNYVNIDYAKKREYIEHEMVHSAAPMGLHVQIDEDLLDEIAGLVEYPFVYIGIIDEQFMHLPPVVLSTSMKIHQKYFTLIYPDSTIAPFFITITNVPGTDIMHAGLNRVLRARLSDAKFFLKKDAEITLEAFAQQLSDVVFHEKLGSIAQKISRMMSVAATKEEYRTIALCKADLLTSMVGEFPELQGIMGAIYAQMQKEDRTVCNAIKDHYKPNSAHDSLPESYVGARASFFDKLDSLVGFLGIGIFPTGSKDPFALRRAGYCIVRLLCDFKENILSGKTFSWYINTIIEAYIKQEIVVQHDTLNNVINFVIDRLKIYMTDKLHFEYNIVNAIISSYDSYDFNFQETIVRAQNLTILSRKKEFDIIKNAYKRATSMIDNKKTICKIENLKFDNQYMQSLQDILKKLKNSQEEEDIIKASEAVLTACDNVVINDEDNKKKANNTVLLAYYIVTIKRLVGNIQ